MAGTLVEQSKGRRAEVAEWGHVAGQSGVRARTVPKLIRDSASASARANAKECAVLDSFMNGKYAGPISLAGAGYPSEEPHAAVGACRRRQRVTGKVENLVFFKP